ncbi:IclR family transcriptional regulator [Lysinibacillus capsici]|uniref:IclR family transcriptional regulator n=1 Tax=Lysinibacillus capsici TaxID=2115968 RepID=UPI0036A9E153
MRSLNIEYNHSVDKAIDIIDAFSISKPALTIEEIIKHTGIPKTTAYRLLYTLERRGIISYESNTSTYKLGLQLFRYFRVLSSSLNVVNEAEPILTELQNKTGKTVLLSLYEGDNMVFVFERATEGGLIFSPYLNKRKPITFGVLGKIFMAFLSEDELDILLKNPLPNYTPNSIVDKDTLLKQLKEIRKDKIAFEKEEADIGVAGIGAPIFNADGNVFAAIGIFGPTIYFTPETFETEKNLLDFAAKEISAKMGFEL